MNPVDLEREFAAFISQGGIGEAELFQLGRYAGEIAAERRGPHRIIAYVLRTVLFDLARRTDDMPIKSGEGDLFFRSIEGPFRAAIAELQRPTTAEQAIQLVDRLLDATEGLLR